MSDLDEITFGLKWNHLDDETKNKLIKVQAIIRGRNYRKNNLPNSILSIQKFLKSKNITFSQETDDGRTNSCIDEGIVIQMLKDKFGNRIQSPEKRHWFDFKVLDFQYSWLPVNIKTTTMKTCDNTGNLAMCYYGLTGDLDLDKSYNNGPISVKVLECIIEEDFSEQLKKDYYFLVLNKTESKDIIVNSYRGLTHLTANINNLPFQVRWEDNREFKYSPVHQVAKKLITTLKKPKPSWSEMFLSEVRKL